MGPTKKYPSRRLRAQAGPRSVLAGVDLKGFYFQDQTHRIFSKMPARLPAGQLFEAGRTTNNDWPSPIPITVN